MAYEFKSTYHDKFDKSGKLSEEMKPKIISALDDDMSTYYKSKDGSYYPTMEQVNQANQDYNMELNFPIKGKGR